MEIDMADLGKFVEPNGNDDPFNYSNAIIAHEMVDAVFTRNLNMGMDENGNRAIPK